MRKVSLIVVLLVALSIQFVSAEQGDIEVGIGQSDYTHLYGVYNATDRIEIEAYFGYYFYSEGVTDLFDSELDKYFFGASGGYDLQISETHDLIVGLDIGHIVRTYDTNNIGRVGWNISALIKYTYNFKFGLTLGLGLKPGLLLNTYDGSGGSTTPQTVQLNYITNAFIGWKF